LAKFQKNFDEAFQRLRLQGLRVAVGLADSGTPWTGLGCKPLWRQKLPLGFSLPLYTRLI